MKRFKTFLIVVSVLVVSAFISWGISSILKRPVDGIEIGRGKVAVIKVTGVIREADDYLELLDRAEKEKSVKAVILRVNSPGGVVGACQEIHDKVVKLSEEKPVVVSMESVAASGGLYISVGATKIVANPGTITGSIGVILQTYNVSKLIKKLGVEVITVKSGPYKDLLNPFKKPDPKQIAVVQKLIDDSYMQFVRAVAEGRKLPVEKVKKFADGRIFTGEEAKRLGLVDYLGNFEKAVEVAKKLGKCPNAEVVFMRKKVSFIDRILGRGSENLIKNLVRALNGNVEEVRTMYLLN